MPKITMTPVVFTIKLEKILLDLLWEKFLDDLKTAKLCASDKLPFIIGEYGSQESIDHYWFIWLAEKGYIPEQWIGD